MVDEPESPTPDPDAQVMDLREVPVDRVVEQVAAELAMIAAAHLGLLPDLPEGPGDARAARLALDAGSSLVEALRAAGGGPAAEDLRRTYADLMLAFAQIVPPSGGEPASGPEGTPPEPPSSQPGPPPTAPPRPSIWTPGGEV